MGSRCSPMSSSPSQEPEKPISSVRLVGGTRRTVLCCMWRAIHPARCLAVRQGHGAGSAGGVARKYNAPFEVEACKAKFFEIYMARYAVPGETAG